MGNYYNKIKHIYPDALDTDFSLASSGNGIAIEYWNDAKLGTKPTFAQIDGQVDDATADAAALDQEADNSVTTNKFNMLLFEINFDQENRLRVLESKQPVTKLQYKTAIKNLYKGL